MSDTVTSTHTTSGDNKSTLLDATQPDSDGPFAPPKIDQSPSLHRDSQIQDGQRPSNGKPVPNSIRVDRSVSRSVTDSTGDIPVKASSPNSKIYDSSYDDTNVIPPKHDCRTLVLCFDGTGDQFDDDNSNIVQLFSMLKKHDRTHQMVYYQPGIGTYAGPGVTITAFTRKLSKILDEAFAWSLHAHVMGGYEFLMQNYHDGDKICIFGFSRGSYTARALAGMLHKVGLLPASNHQQIPFAYKMFKRQDETGWKQSTAFKKAFSINVDIEFLGVWDTVNSVGLFPRRLPFTTNNTTVKTFRHAVSLDEHRAKFKANLWHRSRDEQTKLGTQPGDMSTDKRDQASGEEEKHMNEKSEREGDNKASEEEGKTGIRSSQTENANLRREEAEFDMKLRAEERSNEKEQVQTDVLEVWFAGCHCDVGGGAVSNTTPHSLARIPLRWMIRQCFLANTGIMFHGELLKKIGLDPSGLYPVVKERPPALGVEHYPRISQHMPSHASLPKRRSRIVSGMTLVGDSPRDQKIHTKGKGGVQDKDSEGPLEETRELANEEEEDLVDAMCPVYDQLAMKKGWWILEVVPLKHKEQRDDNDEWFTKFRMNLGRPRRIPKQKDFGVKVHRTVQARMEAEEFLHGGKYHPKTKFHVEPSWVG